MQTYVLIAGALVIGLVAYTVWGMIRLQTPTRGPAIDPASRPGEALSDANRAEQLCVRPDDLAYIQEIRRNLNAPNP